MMRRIARHRNVVELIGWCITDGEDLCICTNYPTVLLPQFLCRFHNWRYYYSTICFMVLQICFGLFLKSFYLLITRVKFFLEPLNYFNFFMHVCLFLKIMHERVNHLSANATKWSSNTLKQFHFVGLVLKELTGKQFSQRRLKMISTEIFFSICTYSS